MKNRLKSCLQTAILLGMAVFLSLPNHLRAQSPSLYSNQLPPVDSLVHMALQKSKFLKAKDRSIAVMAKENDLRKLDWAEALSVYSNAAYGNSNVSSLNQTTNDLNQLLVNRRDLFANVGLTARISLGTVLKKNQQQQLDLLNMEQAIAEKEDIEDQIRLKVVHLYDDLNMTLRSLPTKSENLEAFKLSAKMAERLFLDGTMDVGAYTMILAQKIKAEEELEKTTALAQMQLHELQIITGWQVF